MNDAIRMFMLALKKVSTESNVLKFLLQAIILFVQNKHFFLYKCTMCTFQKLRLLRNVAGIE